MRLRGGSPPPAAPDTPPSSATNFRAVSGIPSCPYFVDGDAHSLSSWLAINESFMQAFPTLTPNEKFGHLLTLLPTNLLSFFSKSLVQAVSAVDPYSVLRTALLDFNKPTDLSIFDKYFKNQNLGSDKPSVFLKRTVSELRLLCGGHEPNPDIVRKFFLRVLPQQAQAILVASPISTPEELASLADKILEVLPTREPNYPIIQSTSELQQGSNYGEPSQNYSVNALRGPAPLPPPILVDRPTQGFFITMRTPGGS